MGGCPDSQVGTTDLKNAQKLNFSVINGDFLLIEVTLPEERGDVQSILI